MKKIPPNTPKIGKRFFLLIRVGNAGEWNANEEHEHTSAYVDIDICPTFS